MDAFLFGVEGCFLVEEKGPTDKDFAELEERMFIPNDLEGEAGISF